MCQIVIVHILISVVLAAKPPHLRPSEDERVQLWYQAGNVWPPQWQPETEAMKEVLEYREKQILNISYSAERWENYLQFTQQRMVPKLTANGFEKVKIPQKVSRYIFIFHL